MTERDQLGNRMKEYEAVETTRKFDPALPVYARIDGRGFSKFTKNMERPFDERMTETMIETTRYLVDKTHAVIGFTESDEISLAWDGSIVNNKHFFDGKIQKACSVIASMAAAKFAVEYFRYFRKHTLDCPHFDCRILQLPSKTETANMFLWRELDAQKNAISMAARCFFSHKELQNKSGQTMISMMGKIGVDINNYPVKFRQGTWLQRVAEDRVLTPKELSAIPAQFRPAAESIFTRSVIKEINMPSFIKVKNREQVIFENAMPIT